MENNIALSLREIANKINDEREQQKFAQHQNFIEGSVLPYLQKLAEEGNYKADFSVPGYNPAIVRDLLKKVGFEATLFKYSGSYRLSVKW